MSEKTYYVYILCCGDGSLYTGLTCDLARRLHEHQSGGRRAARYTRARQPVELIWQSSPLSGRSEAARLEYRLKRMKREDRLRWIQTQYELSQRSIEGPRLSSD
jgi:putative endonuclease